MSTLESLLNRLRMQVGSVFFIPNNVLMIDRMKDITPSSASWTQSGADLQPWLDNILKKIQQAQAQALLIDGTYPIQIIAEIKAHIEIPIIIRVSPSMLTKQNLELFELADFIEILVLEECELQSQASSGTTEQSLDRSLLKDALLKDTRLKEISYFLFQNIKYESLNSLHDAIEDLKRPVFFEFTNYAFQNKKTYSISQVYKFIQSMYEKFSLACLPPPGRDIWDDTISADLQLEPQVEITFQIGSFEKIEHSIIIPTYNSKHYLANVLKHLVNQNIDRRKFEIIVVDDGSSDGSQDYIQNLFSRHDFTNNFEATSKTNLVVKRDIAFSNFAKNENLSDSTINLKYIYFPRPGLRQRGDSYFRAGLSRNLGFSHSVGKRLSFLDSDILVPIDFLAETQRLIEVDGFDLIQHTRFHIKPEYSNEYIRFSDVNLESQTFIEEKNYWKPFFDAQSWVDMDTYWKYTCTYCLTLKREDFVRLGRFRRTFVSYGFEDTDLGYRFAKAGMKFYLSKNCTLHLTPHKTQSEYQHNQFVRHTLLSKTAKKFFLNHLDPKIYEHFQIYMGGEYPLFRRLLSFF